MDVYKRQTWELSARSFHRTNLPRTTLLLSRIALEQRQNGIVLNIPHIRTILHAMLASNLLLRCCSRAHLNVLNTLCHRLHQSLFYANIVSTSIHNNPPNVKKGIPSELKLQCPIRQCFLEHKTHQFIIVLNINSPRDQLHASFKINVLQTT